MKANILILRRICGLFNQQLHGDTLKGHLALGDAGGSQLNQGLDLWSINMLLEVCVYVQILKAKCFAFDAERKERKKEQHPKKKLERFGSKKAKTFGACVTCLYHVQV